MSDTNFNANDIVDDPNNSLDNNAITSENSLDGNENSLQEFDQLNSNEEVEESTNIEEASSDTNTTPNEEDSSNQNEIEENSGSDPEVDYKAFYEEVSKPFKANGIQMKINSPEEAIKLMQMGANYTQKMQVLAPHRKILRMLEKNQLVDEDKISYLIDLNKKNPTAIKKLIQDSNMDSWDLTQDEPVEYTPNPENKVSDQEVLLDATIKDVSSQPQGQEFIKEMLSWDNSSKAAISLKPQIINILNTQRQSGVYKKITDEIKRQEVLGNFNANTPFLEKYKIVGDMLVSKLQKQQNQNTMQNRYNPGSTQQIKATSVQRAGVPKAKRKLTIDEIMNADSSQFEQLFKQWQQTQR